MIAIVIIEGIIICVLSCTIVYLVTKKEQIKKPNVEEKEKERQEKIDNSFRELMAYTEHVAIKGRGTN